jgi:hypothetical protein
MTALEDSGLTDRARAIRAAHETKARAELAIADARAPGSDVVVWRGCLVPDVAVVKGLPGPAEAAGGAAVSGADGEAVARALERLGHDPALVFYTLARPEPGIEPAARADRLRLQIEAVDAALVIALDADAAADLARAFELRALPAGRVVIGCGRRFVAADGLEASLSDPVRKRRVWRQLSAAAPAGPVF